LATNLWQKPSDTLVPAAVSLISGQTPVTDQGTRPICAALAATAAHEYGRGGLRLSVEHLWANTDARGGVVSGGAKLSVLRTALVLDGQCEEGFWPYGNLAPTPAPQPMPTTIHKASSASQVSAASLAVVQSELVVGRPAVLVINPNPAFGLGASPIDASTTDPADSFLHAVVAVGYDDGRAIVTVRNSWGATWGAAGYADLTYEFVALRGRAVLSVVI
jgi:papain like protease